MLDTQCMSRDDSLARLHFSGVRPEPGWHMRRFACSDRSTRPSHCSPKSRISFCASPDMPTPAFLMACKSSASHPIIITMVAIHRRTQCNLAKIAGRDCGCDCGFKLLHQQHIDRRDVRWQTRCLPSGMQALVSAWLHGNVWVQ